MADTRPSAPAVLAALDRAHVASQVAGAAAVAALPGNPHGFDVLPGPGPVRAIRSRSGPAVPWYNRAFGVDGDPGALPEVVAFLRGCGARGRIEVRAETLTPTLGTALHDAGFALEGTSVVLARAAAVGDAGPGDRSGEDVVAAGRGGTSGADAAAGGNGPVEVVESPLDGIELFLDVWARGFGVPEAARPQVTALRCHWFTAPGFRRYLAVADGEAIGAAGFYLDGDVGYGAFAATPPEHRGRGAQSALLRHRHRVSTAACCAWYTAQCDPCTTSQWNMERAGMSVVGTRLVFVDTDPGAI